MFHHQIPALVLALFYRHFIKDVESMQAHLQRLMKNDIDFYKME